MGPDATATIELDGPLDVRQALTGYHIAGDPTRRSGPDGRVVFAGRTPDGPATVRVGATTGAGLVEAWGPGAGWFADRAPALTGRHDDPRPLRFDHPELDELNRRNPGLRHGATGCVVDGLLGRVTGQRVLSTEAGRSWSAMCRDLGDVAPGPFELHLPPDPERLADAPSWWFHERGIERSRATTLVTVARRAGRLAEVISMPLPDAYARLRALPGLGPWTVNGVARVALGDPDAIVVGDYWIKHVVVSYLTGRPRGSDEEMLELVERWTGQRGRVERLINRSGHRIQRYGPGIRTPRIARL